MFMPRLFYTHTSLATFIVVYHYLKSSHIFFDWVC